MFLLRHSIGCRSRHQGPLLSKDATRNGADCEHRLTPIWKPQCCLVHSCAHRGEIAVQSLIIERTQFHPHLPRFPQCQSCQSKEGGKSRPGRLGIGGWKAVVMNPYDQIREPDFALCSRLNNFFRITSGPEKRCCTPPAKRCHVLAKAGCRRLRAH